MDDVQVRSAFGSTVPSETISSRRFATQKNSADIFIRLQDAESARAVETSSS
ncbi:MAG TPA: hypothetical protein VHX20_10260 [Terracidiphilus sp.]|jgi:hypothetical protein|nr:hypothetical protein [Terracidiphilus sp.]